MLPKKNRLNKKLFDKTFKKSNIYHSNSFYFKLSKLEEGKDLKFTFVIPTKIFKKATERNKLRRQCYNILNKYIGSIKKGFAGIFFIKKEILKYSPSNYEEEILSLLKKSKLLK